MSRWNQRREQFRSIVSGERCVAPASVFDPVSARIAAELDYECSMLAGSIASLAVLGAPDIIVLTLSEFAEQAYRISRAAPTPLLVDADHGYGNALNVMRTVEELENAGVAGLSIEDTELPQPYGSERTTLTSIEEGAGKVRAALEARCDPALVIAGRTSAPQVSDTADTIKRAQAYASAGADAVFLVGVADRAQLETITAAVDVPLILGGAGKTLREDPQYLATRGVRVCLQGHQPFMAAARAIADTMRTLRDGGAPDAQSLAGAGDIERWSQKSRYDAWRKTFLGLDN